MRFTYGVYLDVSVILLLAFTIFSLVRDAMRTRRRRKEEAMLQRGLQGGGEPENGSVLSPWTVRSNLVPISPPARGAYSFHDNGLDLRTTLDSSSLDGDERGNDKIERGLSCAVTPPITPKGFRESSST